MAASSNSKKNRENNSDILKSASLTGYTELDSKDPEATKKHQRNIIIGCASGILIVFLLVLFLFPSSPLSFLNPDSVWANMGKEQIVDVAENKKDEIRAAYAEQGIELNDEDFTVEIIENEDGTQTVDVKVSNEEKANQMKDAMQNKLDGFYSKYNAAYFDGVNRDESSNGDMNNKRNDPNYNGNRPWIDQNKDTEPTPSDNSTNESEDGGPSIPNYEDLDQQGSTPTIEEVIADSNTVMLNLNRYLITSIEEDKLNGFDDDDSDIDYDNAAQEDASEDINGDGTIASGEIPDWDEPLYDNNMQFNYTELLLNQRQTGSPSSDTPFVFSIDDDYVTTYGDMNQRLNGQAFINMYMRSEFSANDNWFLRTFNPFNYDYYSNDLFNNLLNKGVYKLQLKPSSVIEVSECDGKEYTLHTPYYDETFNARVKMKTSSGYNIILGMYDYKWIVLDIL